MKNENVKKLDLEKIPIIDIINLINGKDKISVAKKLYFASKKLGFIYIKNHGISQSIIEALRNDGLKFLEKPARKNTS